jgi:hypothetical protein
VYGGGGCPFQGRVFLDGEPFRPAPGRDVTPVECFGDELLDKRAKDRQQAGFQAGGKS